MQINPSFASVATLRFFGCVATIYIMSNSAYGQTVSTLALPSRTANSIRVATFNMALNRKEPGQLVDELTQGDDQAMRVATIVQLVQPDVLLANEVDYSEGKAAKVLMDEYLNKARHPKIKSLPCNFKSLFAGPVNTGVPSGLDLNLNGRTTDNEDAWGYGAFPGQYGMVVFSKFPISESQIRTFQMLRWSLMPNAKRPKSIDKSTGQDTFYYNDEVWKQLRISSKSHWDVPIQFGNKLLHIIASHPTPPVFDGPEDRNGCRNHDEIQLLRHYVEASGESDYIVDDRGKAGALPKTAHFVIAGDLNADPNDGSGISKGILDLLHSSRVSSTFVPESRGAVEASQLQGKANAKHTGNPAHDTGDFNDASVGNLRIDFVLPSSNCKIVAGGVFWPTNSQLEALDPKLVDASDHHLVWIDIELTETN
jgi:hypothetical protein